ncbi:MAG: hypothetical protein LBC28_03360 [Oscillospiraceae bacterium]|jgi:hypothetical protein|nr:hypothetical protein [Oscillospiraceae bacterium]
MRNHRKEMRIFTRAIAALLSLAAIFALAACGGDAGTTQSPPPSAETSPADTTPETATPETATPETPEATDALSEPEQSVDSLLQEILDSAGAGLEGEDALPMSFLDPVTEENYGKLGLSESDFALVDTAYTAIAGIISQAHEVALLYAPGHAAELKDAIAAGYDSGKWVCVSPDKSAVIASGDYVLLAASRNATVDALVQAFRELVGDGEVNVFYTSA